MKNKQLYDQTDNRAIYNKLHKHLNASCSYCAWHRCDNKSNRKWYGVYITKYAEHESIGKREPNWKLVSKNRKQWMHKTIRKTYWAQEFREGIEYKF